MCKDIRKTEVSLQQIMELIVLYRAAKCIEDLEFGEIKENCCVYKCVYLNECEEFIIWLCQRSELDPFLKSRYQLF